MAYKMTRKRRRGVIRSFMELSLALAANVLILGALLLAGKYYPGGVVGYEASARTTLAATENLGSNPCKNPGALHSSTIEICNRLNQQKE